MESDKSKRGESPKRSITGLSSFQKHLWIFIGLMAVLTTVFWKSLLDLLQLSFSYHQHYSHIVLIPLISLYFLITERKEIFGRSPVGHKAGLILLSIGAFMGLMGKFWISGLNSNDLLSLMVFAFVICIWGIFILVFGIKISLRAAFPLGFLLLLIPIPSALLAWTIEKLLWGSTIATHWFFHLTGTPFLSDGPVFTLPGLQIEIAEVCSGIRSSIALMITGILAARLFLSGWWSRALLISAIFPLAVIKNGFRIVSLSLLTIYVDEGFMTGDLHRKGGIFFFTVTLVLMGLYLSALILIERWMKKRRNKMQST